jgi:hypothetical protein
MLRPSKIEEWTDRYVPTKNERKAAAEDEKRSKPGQIDSKAGSTASHPWSNI